MSAGTTPVIRVASSAAHTDDEHAAIRRAVLEGRVRRLEPGDSTDFEKVKTFFRIIKRMGRPPTHNDDHACDVHAVEHADHATAA